MGAEFSTFTNPVKADRFALLLLGSSRVLSRHSDRATERASVRLAAKIRSGIRSQAPGGKAFEPLKQATIERKGSSKALIDKADLVRSIQSQKLATSVYLVGVHRTARNRSGMKLVLIAKVHEQGYPSGATKAGEGATRTDNLNIPARPYMEPTFRQEEDEIVSAVGKETGESFFSGF